MTNLFAGLRPWIKTRITTRNSDRDVQPRLNSLARACARANDTTTTLVPCVNYKPMVEATRAWKAATLTYKYIPPRVSACPQARRRNAAAARRIQFYFHSARALSRVRAERSSLAEEARARSHTPRRERGERDGGTADF